MQPTKFPRAKPYRRTPNEIKAVVRFRDGYRCTRCGTTAKQNYRKYKQALDVHRVVPGSRYSLRGCITLCKECHNLAHRRVPGKVYTKSIKISADIRQMLGAIADANNENLSACFARLVGPTLADDYKRALQLISERFPD